MKRQAPTNPLPSGMHLLIFDVDGTLVRSLEGEALLYPRACEQALGIPEVSSDWESYHCPSDRGIVSQLIEMHFEREPSPSDYTLVEQHFLALIRDAYDRQPNLCRPVRGAIEAISRFRSLPELALSIATAGWQSTALHKLAFAGHSVEDLPIASSNDAEEKVHILRIAAERAAMQYGVRRFESVICFGDTVGDARAARKLGYKFIGIDTSGFVPEPERRYSDFAAIDDIIGVVRQLAAPSDAHERTSG